MDNIVRAMGRIQLLEIRPVTPWPAIPGARQDLRTRGFDFLRIGVLNVFVHQKVHRHIRPGNTLEDMKQPGFITAPIESSHDLQNPQRTLSCRSNH